MRSKLAILGCLLFYLISGFADTDKALAALFNQAESYIKSKPAESSIPVVTIYQKYNQLQEKFVGYDNSKLNQQQISLSPLFAKTNLFESKPPVAKDASIKFIRLRYLTPNSYGKQQVSGLLLLPPAKPKGIVLFFHSTISGKLNVPSLQFNEYKAQALAAVFAANGYIVAVPDYIGLGDNFKVAHPYIIYPEMNVTDGKNMLIAARQYLITHKLINPASNLPLYVSGYSEGASYALWFSRIYQENPKFSAELNKSKLQLKRTIPIDGAYNITGVMFPFLLTNQVNDEINKFSINSAIWGTLLKPSLLANVMIGYSYYNQQPLSSLLNRDFMRLQCNLLLQNSCGQEELNQYDLTTFMLTPTKNFSMVFKYFLVANFKSGQGIIYSPFFNSVYPLLAEGVATDKNLMNTAAKANILKWKSNYPITLISLSKDSVVPEKNSSDAYLGMLEKGSKQVKYIQVDNQILKSRSLFGTTNIDHVSFEIYALLIALKEIQD